MKTVKNIGALVIFGLWVYAGIRLALHWEFGDLWNAAAYCGIVAFLFLLAASGISGVYRAGTHERNPFC